LIAGAKFNENGKEITWIVSLPGDAPHLKVSQPARARCGPAHLSRWKRDQNATKTRQATWARPIWSKSPFFFRIVV